MAAVELPGKKKFEPNTYAFSTQNQSFQYVDIIQCVDFAKPIEGKVVQFEDETLVITFDDPLPEPVIEIEVEWINDFILRRTLDQIEHICAAGNDHLSNRIEEIFGDASLDLGDNSEETIFEDGMRNKQQKEAIQKALKNRVTYIWGPPGTGKTATLGFIIANHLQKGNRVLFASNTNRAVDVGLMSVLSALSTTGEYFPMDKITRFGDNALDNEQLTSLQFDEQLKKKKELLIQEIRHSESSGGKKRLIEDTINRLEKAGMNIPESLESQLGEYSGEHDEAQEELLDALDNLAFKELKNKQLVATTLARVCTSDLLFGQAFDAVVIDEASMAGIPYVMILAARSKKHIVFCGDPMQLPPIASTDSFKHKDFLEKDVYMLVSGARQIGDLFAWKDKYPDQTCFFDTQYRLNSDLASVISEIFYDGRLKTGKKPASLSAANPTVTVHVIDSSKYNPSIKINRNEGGFRPQNEVHSHVVIEMIRRLILKERTPPSSIGVIVPFRSVVWDYRRLFREEGFYEVEVGTIHTFQGREKSAIIFDSVMSGQPAGFRKRHFSVRPFDETKNGLSVPRLLNVAFSRAKDRLLILADMEHIDEVYGKLFLGKVLRSLQELNIPTKN